jgi:hypothetical protein
MLEKNEPDYGNVMRERWYSAGINKQAVGSRVGDPADAVGAAPSLRGAAGKMYRLRRLP